MTLKISHLASLEITDAKEYYNLQKPTLGDTFKNDVKGELSECPAFAKIKSWNMLRWHKIEK